MAPPKSGSKPQAEQAEHILQAIVLSDSYNNRFRPLTLEKPRCLLPLANTPLIEYTFEFLALAGVQEVYVFLSSHAQQVKDYIKNSKWALSSSPFTVHTIVSPESMSVGDALRELDAKQLITSDFVLVSGDVVSNIPLDDILKEHRARREADKDAIMTMVVREASPTHRTRARAESSVFVLDSNTHECVHWEPVQQFPRKTNVAMNVEIFADHPEVELRNDLIDCQIDICSPDVPLLFTENFDYQEMRQDFVHGILTSDLLGKKIHCHVAEKDYSARVRNLQTYDAISKDTLSRWTYPMVPDSNLMSDQTYQYSRGHVYKEADVVLARSCKIKERVVIGADTRIGHGAVIESSTIGRRCTIGDNVKIDGAYIWDDVTIGKGTVVEKAIIANGAILGENCKVEAGAIISYGVRVADGVTVAGATRLTKYIDEEDDDEEISSDPRVVGTDGEGYAYEEAESDMEDEDEAGNVEASRLVYNMQHLNLSDTSVSSIASSEDEYTPGPGQRRLSTATTMSATSDASEEHTDYYKEAQASLDRAFEDDHPVDIAALEINTLRMAANVSYHEVRASIINAFLGLMLKKVQAGVPVQKAVQDVIVRWASLLGRMTSGQADQVDVILSLQSMCAKKPDLTRFWTFALRYLYDEDVLDEDGILAWFANPQSKGSEAIAEMGKLREAAVRFVQYLVEASEEEDSSDDDE
ncbi:translation initiation factor eIF-2B epsilon subunit, GEF [Saitoella coloradoensis]